MDGYSWRNREIDSERETKKKMTVSLTETVKTMTLTMAYNVVKLTRK